MARPLVTAHRGSSAIAPENTLASLRQAILDGADLAEVDVQATADGELVLGHDADLQRVAGDPRHLWQMTYPEVARLDVGHWFDPRFSGERIPRLQDAIALVKGRLQLNLELKAYGPTPNLAPQVVDQVLACDFAQDCLVTSFDPALLRQVRQRAPQLILGLICETFPASLAEFDLYSLPFDLVTPERVHQIHALNKAIHVWTVNQPEGMRRLIQLGVDSLITDNPRLLRQVLGKG